MNISMIKKLKSMVDVPIRLCYYVGEGGGRVPDYDMYNWVGKIKSLDDNGLLEFEHISIESNRMQIKKSWLDLQHTWIWVFDELAEDYDNAIFVKCSKCENEMLLRDLENTTYK